MCVRGYVREDMAESSRKSPGRPFAKGQSGNPGGRPRKTQQDVDLINACKALTQDALDTLIEIMRNGQERNRITAAVAIIERGHGKPIQPSEVDLRGEMAGRIEIVIVDPAR